MALSQIYRVVSHSMIIFAAIQDGAVPALIKIMIRFLKVFGVFMLILTIGFFSLGFIYPEVSYSTEITINKPVRTVFRKYNDPGTLKQWIPEMKSLEIVEIKPGMVGTKMKMTIVNSGRTMVIEEEVIAYEENKVLGLHLESGPMRKKDHIEFIESGESTIIKGDYTCTGSNLFYRSLFSLFQGQFKSMDESYLGNFKKFVEQ